MPKDWRALIAPYASAACRQLWTRSAMSEGVGGVWRFLGRRLGLASALGGPAIGRRREISLWGIGGHHVHVRARASGGCIGISHLVQASWKVAVDGSAGK